MNKETMLYKRAMDTMMKVYSTPKGENWTYELYKKAVITGRDVGIKEDNLDFINEWDNKDIPDAIGYHISKIFPLDNNKIKANHCDPWSELDWEPDPERDMYLKYVSLDACIVSEELSSQTTEYDVDSDHKPNIVEHNKKRYICGEWKFSEREAMESSILERNKFMREIESIIEKGYRKF